MALARKAKAAEAKAATENYVRCPVALYYLFVERSVYELNNKRAGSMNCPPQLIRCGDRLSQRSRRAL